MFFKTEYATYKAKLEELRPYTGQWVLLRHAEVVGIYPTWQEVCDVADVRFAPGESCIIQIETPIDLEFDLSPELEEHLQAA